MLKKRSAKVHRTRGVVKRCSQKLNAITEMPNFSLYPVEVALQIGLELVE